MTRIHRLSTALAIVGVAGWLCGAPAQAFAQDRPTSARPPSAGDGGGSARPAPAPSGGGGGGSSSSGGDGGFSAPAPRSSAPARAADPSGNGRSARRRPTSRRPPTAGVPVGRTTGAAPRGTAVIVPGYYGGFYPWGYGGLGIGGYFAGYYSYYDPWLYDSYYAPPYIAADEDDSGTLRLKVKPRDAMVYVDGYYAGRVDDFDGVFQRLHIDSGPHRIEIRADGYEPLTFDINVRRRHAMTYDGELERTE